MAYARLQLVHSLEAGDGRRIVVPRVVVVAPTYNNAATLVNVLERVESQRLPLIVVNDGSTDGTADALRRWLSQPRHVTVDVVVHERNRGKAAALHAGFQHAMQAGYTHAVTIDTDGQLDPEDIPALLALSSASPWALVLGVRPGRLPDCPPARASPATSRTLP